MFPAPGHEQWGCRKDNDGRLWNAKGNKLPNEARPQLNAVQQTATSLSSATTNWENSTRHLWSSCCLNDAHCNYWQINHLLSDDVVPLHFRPTLHDLVHYQLDQFLLHSLDGNCRTSRRCLRCCRSSERCSGPRDGGFGANRRAGNLKSETVKNALVTLWNMFCVFAEQIFLNELPN